MLFVMQTVAIYIHIIRHLFKKHKVANLIKDMIQKFKTMPKLWWSLDNFKWHHCTSESNVTASMPHTSQHSNRWRLVKRWTPHMPCDAGILKCCTYQDINICSLAVIMSRLKWCVFKAFHGNYNIACEIWGFTVLNVKTVFWNVDTMYQSI